jgi:PLP dependent protein
MTSPDRIGANVAAVRARIEAACGRADRDPADVLLVAAAKTQPVAAVRAVVESGVISVGENYVAELRAIHHQVPEARWHYIGALQTNTAHHVAALADVVETLSGERATRRLGRRALEAGRTIDALIEVDLTGERTGVSASGTTSFADAVASIEGLRLRGLMTIAPIGRDAEDARPWFRTVRDLRDRIRERHPDMVELSMGMSLDYEAAVEEGATMVRIGTALFGERTP